MSRTRQPGASDDKRRGFTMTNISFDAKNRSKSLSTFFTQQQDEPVKTAKKEETTA